MKKCDTHTICIASDSNLPECKCWCAECKEWREYNSYIWKKYPITTFSEYFKEVK